MISQRLLPFSFHVTPMLSREESHFVRIAAHQCAVTIVISLYTRRRVLYIRDVGVTGTLRSLSRFVIIIVLYIAITPVLVPADTHQRDRVYRAEISAPRKPRRENSRLYSYYSRAPRKRESDMCARASLLIVMLHVPCYRANHRLSHGSHIALHLYLVFRRKYERECAPRARLGSSVSVYR